MKKFKHISELKERQLQLHKRQHELEMLIHYGWRDLKNNFVPDTVSYGKSVLLDKVKEGVRNYFAKK